MKLEGAQEKNAEPENTAPNSTEQKSADPRSAPAPEVEAEVAEQKDPKQGKLPFHDRFMEFCSDANVKLIFDHAKHLAIVGAILTSAKVIDAHPVFRWRWLDTVASIALLALAAILFMILWMNIGRRIFDLRGIVRVVSVVLYFCILILGLSILFGPN